MIAGGEVPDAPGYFIKPTIVRDIEEGSRLVDEEQFGPGLPVLKFNEEDDAVARANAGGRPCLVIDLDKALCLAEKMFLGTIWINKSWGRCDSIRDGSNLI